MSSNNWWLHRQIKNKGIPGLDNNPEPLIVITRGSHSTRIYTPDPDEYVITVDVVQKVIELGGTIISYPIWCVGPTGDAIALAENHGLLIQKHGKTLGQIF